MQTPIEHLKLSIQPTREALLAHKMYSQIKDFEGIYFQVLFRKTY